MNLRQLSQKGPQIGPDKQRLHAWLSQNGLLFYQVTNLGSNLTGLVSQVHLNSLISVNDGLTALGDQIRAAKTDAEIDQLLDISAELNREIFMKLYPDYYSYQSTAHLAQIYDSVPIDVKSLKAYMIWINTKSKLINSQIVRELTDKAQMILAVANHTKGVYYQRKKPSEFGRMYYEGLSVQNVKKELRYAMLGDCWELDLRSSVVAFKLGFAKTCAQNVNSKLDYRRQFGSSIWFLEDRAYYLKLICKDVFQGSSNTSLEFQCGLIKEALTAISFGARANKFGWRTQDGNWKNPSLKEIIKNPDQYQKFINNYEVKNFIEEQSLLDDFLFDGVKKSYPELLEKKNLKSGASASKSKLVSYLYQHSETWMMDFVREKLTELNNPAIASIHDAVIVRRELINGRLPDLIYELRREFSNEFLLLKQTKIEGYKRTSIEPEVEDFPMPTVEELLTRHGYTSIEEAYAKIFTTN